MMGGTLPVSGLTAVGLALALSAGTLTAQAPDDTGTDLARAALLEAEAEDLLEGERSGWKKAERLLREASALRPVGDRLAVEDLLAAAKLVYYVGDERRAIRELEAAGQRALDEGNVLTAAHAFADAAWIAKDEGHGTKAIELASRAQRLAHSPLIDTVEREELLGRFSGEPSL